MNDGGFLFFFFLPFLSSLLLSFSHQTVLYSSRITRYSINQAFSLCTMKMRNFISRCCKYSTLFANQLEIASKQL